MEGNKDDMPAQVLTILWKNPFQFLANPTSFFTVHERFAPANIIFSDDVHLLGINSQAATFTKVDCNILNVREHPFFFMAQNMHASKLIILPIDVFYDLIDKTEVPVKKVVWMFHTFRCGSTAWAQAFNSLPGWTVFAEPQALSYRCLFSGHQFSSVQQFSRTETYKKYAVACIQMQLWHAKGDSVFWKATTFDEYLIRVIRECFPGHKMLLAYRDITPSITSYFMSFKNFPHLIYAMNRLNSSAVDDSSWFNAMNRAEFTNGYEFNFFKEIYLYTKPWTGCQWYTFLWCAKVYTMQQALKNGAKIKAIKYDSLVENRRTTVAEVFDYLDISAENVDVACEALNYDSQAGVAMVSWESRRKEEKSAWRNDAKVTSNCNSILSAFGLPNLDQSYDFDMLIKNSKLL